ncbi:DUF1385 domain-containing protein [bacterium]|nr:DUF1385 domain-containing protein [bacterium]
MSEVLKVDPIGGQAVIEGVMMRGKHGVGLAVRTPSGEIHLKQEPIESLRAKYPVLKLPLIRGVAALVESLSLGMRMLNYSAAIAAGEDEKQAESGGWLPLLLGVVVMIAIFKVVPALVFAKLTPLIPNALALSAIEGMIRVGLFVGYLGAISLMPEVKRLFQYHGAEHQVINCVEAGKELTPDNALAFSPIHPRCGTSFLLITLLLQIAVFSLLGMQLSVLQRVAAQLCLLPVVAGISFELIRLAGQTSLQGAKAGIAARCALWVTLPGQWLQRVTTRPASRDQIEVAIASLHAAMAVQPAGSAPQVP